MNDDEREAVIVMDGLDLGALYTCPHSATTTEAQREAMGRSVVTLICSMPVNHGGDRHYDGMDRLTWMPVKDWNDQEGEPGSIDGSVFVPDEIKEDEEEDIVISEKRERPNPGLEIIYSEAQEDD
jgi:hypothetical protein